MRHMRHSRRANVVSLASAVALVAASGRADTLVTGNPATLFTLANKVTGLTEPTSFAFLPSGQMVITQKGGDVLIADTGGATTVAGTFTVDTESEKGLLHVILHPGFATNRLLIFYYSANDSIGGTDVDRHRVVTVPLGTNGKLDLTQEKILVRGLRGPANHDGGSLGIGPDGKLYIGDGDTGVNSGQAPEPPYTPTNFFATCLTIPNGKILRVNLDGSIPNDNPLVNATQVTACGNTAGTDVTTLPPATGSAIRKDIWAWGFRNPWRFWFDPKTGNMWEGDVGEITYEEINIIPQSGKGKHYGWPWREASHGHTPATCQSIIPNAGDCVDPQYYCVHGTSSDPAVDGNCGSIMGGPIVDSCDWPTTFQGRYFFGDYTRKWIANLTVNTSRTGFTNTHRNQFITTSPGGPTHIDVGPDGALYYASFVQSANTGTIVRVAPKTPIACPVPPDGGTGAGGTTSAGGGSSVSGAAGATAGTTGAGGGATGNGGSGQAGATSTGGSSAGGTASGAGGGAQAGTTGSSGASAGGGAQKDASTGTGTGAAGDTGSCGCRVVTDTRPGALGLWSLAAGVVAFARRKRRAR